MIEANMSYSFEVESSRFSKMVLVLTLEQITLKSFKRAAQETDGFLFPIILTQPPASPDLGLFSSLKYHVSQICTHCTSRKDMIANVIKAFDEYPADKLEDN